MAAATPPELLGLPDARSKSSSLRAWRLPLGAFARNAFAQRRQEEDAKLAKEYDRADAGSTRGSATAARRGTSRPSRPGSVQRPGRKPDRPAPAGGPPAAGGRGPAATCA